MPFSVIVLILTALIWIVYEGYLVVRDRVSARGSTTIDQKTRLFNTISIIIALSAPWFKYLAASFNFAGRDVPIILCFGTFLIISGFGLRWWAVATLGRFFRTTVEVESGQRVIESGPYRLIRHPAYSGILLLFLGYGLTAQNWIAMIVAVVFPTFALLYRIGVEEEALSAQLGEPYREYQQRTKRLIPYIW